MEHRRGSAAAAAGAAELELPGFRFHPTEEELLEFYLKQVAHGKKLKFDIIPTVHLYRHDPWELPGLAHIAGEREWYFFVPRDRGTSKQHHHQGRPSRMTERGFWKATGSDRAVRCAADPKRLIGLKKTLVYYEGRAPRGTKTDWVMNEYRLPGDGGDSVSSSDDVVLCKIYRKAVSLKELEQRVAMEELARATSIGTGSGSGHNTAAGSPDVDGSSSVSNDGVSSSSGSRGATVAVISMKKEEAAAVALRLPQLEWMQDPFLTQLRSPWMDTWSPYYAATNGVLNF